jgi:hypothetical protein
MASAVPKFSRWVAWKRRCSEPVSSQAEQAAWTRVGCSVRAAQAKSRAKPR